MSVTLVLATACLGREVAEVEPAQSREQQQTVATEVNRDLDLLFVIDNSGSMTEEQASLAANFDRFIGVLERVEGGLPNVHIGVISTDLGAGSFAIAGCDGRGDDGALQSTPRAAGCSAPAGAFISDVAAGDGSRVANYDGDLADAFACIARLGAEGCGFEQPLEAMRRALDGSQPANVGFLRDQALLGVVFITDEDDCSVFDPQMFDTSQTSVDDPLGPLSSFRCFEFGVQCDPDDPRATGAKADCAPRADSAYMTGVADYVGFLRGLKPRPDDVMVAGIIGNPTPVIVGTDGNGDPTLEPSCQSGAGVAAPAVRLAAFLDGFPGTSTVTTICNDDLSDALTEIAERFVGKLTPCLEGNLADLDPAASGVQPDCVVTEIDRDGAERRLPICDGAMANQPCYTLAPDRDVCPVTPTGLALEIHRGGASVSDDTRVIARCVAD